MRQRAPKLIVRQHFLIPNTVLGRVFLWWARRYLNTETYAIRLRGRTPIVPGKRAGWSCRDVPLSNARRLGVYLIVKPAAQRADRLARDAQREVSLAYARARNIGTHVYEEA